MDEATSELTRTWLIKARADLGSARKLASGPDAYPDAAIYHCQQAAEKAVKGFLTFHEQRFEKVHNLPTPGLASDEAPTGIQRFAGRG